MMIIDWIGRVFGLGATGEPSASLPTGLSLSDITAPTASLVDGDELAAELARARRYEHALSIVVLSAGPLQEHGSQANGNGRIPSLETKLPQMLALLTAVALREVVRCSDVVCYHAAENRFVLGLTESGAEGARSAVERITEHCRSRFHLNLRAGLALFPADAYTLDDLVSTAARRLSPPVPGLASLPQSSRTGRGKRRRRSTGASRLSREEGA